LFSGRAKTVSSTQNDEPGRCAIFETVSLWDSLTKSRLYDRTTTAQSGSLRSPTAYSSHVSNYDGTPIISSH